MTNADPVDILVVEDDDSQRASIVESLQSAIPNVNVVAVHSGTEALDFLLARDDWAERAGAEPPRLILLDLGLPGADGCSVLGQIRALHDEDSLMLTPVVIFTDSQATIDMNRSYRCGANSYIIKPLSFPDFQTIVKTVGTYWISHNMVAT